MKSDPHPLRLAGKRVIITAGASGMGRAGAELFAEHGATVCVVDYNEAKAAETVEAIRGAGGQAHALVADLSSVAESTRIVRDAAELMGGIDGLWAHAGAPGPHGVEGLDFEVYERCIALNVTSVIASISEAVPFLARSGKGAILITSSVSGLVGSLHSPVYSVAKFGVVGLAKSLSLSLGAKGIRVNALCPGITDTPMMPDFMSDAARGKLVDLLPLGRIAQPIEMAYPALFLLSNEASYVTGTAMAVDGGFTAR